jgi:hypothetical protein
MGAETVNRGGVWYGSQGEERWVREWTVLARKEPI